MAGKEICECIPVELIRAQVKGKYKIIKCYDGIHNNTWSKYPCATLERNLCRVDHCSGRISLSIRTPPKDIRILSVLSIRAEKRGYVSLDRHLRSLFENGTIQNVPPVSIELNSPILASTTAYFENPPLPHGSYAKQKK